jgi:hypothetical protein
MICKTSHAKQQLSMAIVGQPDLFSFIMLGESTKPKTDALSTTGRTQTAVSIPIRRPGMN